MKKTIFLSISIILTVLLAACKNEQENSSATVKLPDIPLNVNFETFGLTVQEQIQERIDYIALVDIQKTNDDKSKYGWAIGQLGKVYQAYKLLDEAKNSYINAMHYDPDNYEWYYLQGHVYRDLGLLDKSKAHFEKVINMRVHVPSMVWLSDILIQQNELELAEKFCNQVLAIEKKHPRALYNLALINQNRGHNDKALELLKTVLDSQPRAYQLNYQIGQTYAKIGEYDKAKTYNKLIVDDNDLRVSLYFDDPIIRDLDSLKKDNLTFITRAQKASAQGKYLRAISILNNILNEDKGNLVALYKIAFNYYKLNDYFQAKEFLNQILNLDQEYDKAYALLSLINMNESDYELAYENIKKSVKINPKNRYYLNQFGDVSYRLGKIQEAIGHYQKSLQMQNNQEIVQLKIIRSMLQDQAKIGDALNYIHSLSFSKKYEDTVDNFKLRIDIVQKAQYDKPKINGLDENNIMELETLAMLKANENKFDEAINYQKKAMVMAVSKNINTERIEKRLKLYQNNKPQESIWSPFEPMQLF
ncbi:MAG: tetratricopeptide repeat protein [Marinicellaceae bacterium]